MGDNKHALVRFTHSYIFIISQQQYHQYPTPMSYQNPFFPLIPPTLIFNRTQLDSVPHYTAYYSTYICIFYQISSIYLFKWQNYQHAQNVSIIQQNLYMYTTQICLEFNAAYCYTNRHCVVMKNGNFSATTALIDVHNIWIVCKMFSCIFCFQFYSPHVINF